LREKGTRENMFNNKRNIHNIHNINGQTTEKRMGHTVGRREWKRTTERETESSFFFIWLLIDDAKEGFFFFLVTGERERKC